jgi:uncharacterized protein YndB with AHSA1/START domain
MTSPAQPRNERELVLDRLIDAPREKVYRCWTDPELLVQWFTPKPWTTKSAEIDVRPGGRSLVVMADPEGNEYPNPGIYLDVVPNEKIVFTDAFTAAWEPAERAFFVCELTFADEGGKTRYIARAKHWNADAKAEHEKMGFHEGWGQCADQLEELAKTL